MHQRGVIRQAGQHFAGLGGFKKRRALLQHMAVHRVAHIGRDAFAQPSDGVKTQRRKHRQRRRHQEQLPKLPRQTRPAVRAAQALVNQQAQRPRKRQGGARRQQQKQARQGDAAFVGFDEGQQARQGLRGSGGR